MFLNARDFALLQESLVRDLLAFLPELVLCIGIVLLLLVRLFQGREMVLGMLSAVPIVLGAGGLIPELGWFDIYAAAGFIFFGFLLLISMFLSKLHLGWLALVMSLLSFLVAWEQWNGGPLGAVEFLTSLLSGQFVWGELHTAPDARPIFAGMLAYDGLTIYLRMFLLGFTAFVIWLSLLTGIPDREDAADFYTLLLGATIGMCLMASANHLLMAYIGIEMASLPSYALAGFLKGRRQSSEAALKYVVYGGGASGIMLYGISLIAGKFGTAYLPDLTIAFSNALNQGASSAHFDPVLLLSILFILIGISFKLAAVPFHFWCPDVFEGASAEVAGFLSVASKGAALALLARFTLVLSGLTDFTQATPFPTWVKVVQYLAPALAALAVATATFGNLAAYLQTNLKRLLAYSTIAQAGYMMMGLATMSREGTAAVLFYLAAYLFMNLGAFAVVAFLRNLTGSEDLTSFRGLVRRAPILVLTLAFFLLSLLGLPPLMGFAAKFQVFRSLFDAGTYFAANGQPGLGNTMYALLVIGGLNTVISAVYYIKVLKVMILDRPLDEVEGREPEMLFVPFGSALYASILALVVLVGGIFWDPLMQTTGSSGGVASRFRASPPQKVEMPKNPPMGSGGAGRPQPQL